MSTESSWTAWATLPGTASCRPWRRQAVAASRATDALLETIATRLPRGTGCSMASSTCSTSWLTSSTRMTPGLAQEFGLVG